MPSQINAANCPSINPERLLPWAELAQAFSPLPPCFSPGCPVELGQGREGSLDPGCCIENPTTSPTPHCASPDLDPDCRRSDIECVCSGMGHVSFPVCSPLATLIRSQQAACSGPGSCASGHISCALRLWQTLCGNGIPVSFHI